MNRRIPRLIPLLIPALALALASCENPSEPERRPARVEITGDMQTAVAGAELSQPLAVQVLDERAQPVRGQLVDFRVLSGGGTLTAGGAATDANGRAWVRWTLGTVAGDTQRVEVRALDEATGAVLAADTFRAVAQPDQPATLQPIGGAARTGTFGLPLADSLAVVLRDRWGNAIPGTAITWTVLGGGGSVSPATRTTNAAGVATTQWTLGTAQDPQRVEAAASVGLKTVFTANDGIVPTPVMTLAKVSGDLQYAPVETPLQQPLVVEVRANGQPAAGVQVVWAPGPGMGSAQPSASLTDAQGRASTSWTLGPQAGPQQLTASVEGADPVVFTTGGTPGAVARLEVVAGDSAFGPAGTQVQVAVRALDANGNRTGAGTQVAWSTATGGSIQPVTSITDAEGIARATWTLGAATEQRALASVGGGASRPEVWITARTTEGRPNQIVIHPDGLRFTAPGQTAAVNVVGYNASGDPVGPVPATLTSLDPSVARVSPATAPSTVTAVAPGVTRIVAVHGAGADTIEVVVLPASGAPVSRWERETGQPTTRSLGGVWASSASNVFVAGAEGWVYRWNGARWTPEPHVTSQALADLWGTAAGELFAVGNAGTILRRSAGGTWSTMASPVTAPLWSVWGASASDAWAVGESGTILRYNGTQWSTVASGTTETLNEVWGADGAVFAVGGAGTILRWSGTAWEPMTSGTTQRIVSVWGPASNLMYALTQFGLLLRYDGNAWTVVHDPGLDGLMATTLGGTGAQTVFPAAGRADGVRAIFYTGVIRRWNGAAYVASEALSTNSLINDIWGIPGGPAFAVSNLGEVWHWDGTRWTTLPPMPRGASLHDVWTTDGVNAFAVGRLNDSVLVMRRTAAGWERMAPPPSSLAFSITALSPTLAWAGTTEGIYGWDGNGWTRVHQGPQGFRDVFALSPSQLYAAGPGVVVRWNGAEWVNLGAAGNISWNGVWASSPSDVWAVGGEVAAHFDGTAWTQTTFPLSGRTILAVFGTGPSDVWAVGEGLAFHWNGASWTRVGAQEGVGGYNVWAASPTDVYVASFGGVLWRWNGAAWRRDAEEAGGAALVGVHGAGGHVYAVGNAFTILHGTP